MRPEDQVRAPFDLAPPHRALLRLLPERPRQPSPPRCRRHHHCCRRTRRSLRDRRHNHDDRDRHYGGPRDSRSHPPAKAYNRSDQASRDSSPDRDADPPIPALDPIRLDLLLEPCLALAFLPGIVAPEWSRRSARTLAPSQGGHSSGSANVLLRNPTIAYLTADEIIGSFSRRYALSDGDALPPSTLGIDEDVRSRALDSLVNLDGYPVATRCVANLGDHVVQ